MAIQGSGLHDKNARLRFLVYIFFGIVAFGSLLYWRTAALDSAEYVEIGNAKKAKTQKNESNLRSNRYQIETFDVSPTVN